MRKNKKMTVFWDVAPWSLVGCLVMEAVSSSETSISIYQTAQCNFAE
jgi:hypothetical protein